MGYRGADINAAVGGTGWTPLHGAVFEKDKESVEFLIYEGADLNLLASKRDVAKGAKLTPRQLAEAIQFEPMDIFDKTPPPLIGQQVSPPPADSPPPKVNPSPPPAPQPKSPTPPPSVPATTEGEEKKLPSTEEELEAMIQARIDKAL